jgi:hypothetical protein
LTKGSSKVPVVAVFTKFDQFRLDIQMRLEDEDRDSAEQLGDEVEKRFRDDYFSKLKGSPLYIRLESEEFVIQLTCTIYTNSCPVEMHKHSQSGAASSLIEITANALSGGVLDLLLKAVRKDSQELSINQAVNWYVFTCIGTRMRGA